MLKTSTIFCDANIKEPLLELFKVGAILGVCPPFDLEKGTVRYGKLFREKVFGAALSVTILGIADLWGCGLWGGLHLINVVRMSILISIIITLESLLGAIVRKNVWNKFFAKYVILLQNPSWSNLTMNYHIYRNIKVYLGVYMLITVIVPTQGYILWIKKQEVEFEQKLNIILCLTGDEATLFYYNFVKFIMCAILNDIRIRYHYLSTKINALETTQSRARILTDIYDVEVTALKIYDVACLFQKLFGLHLLLMMAYAFSIGLEFFIYTVNMFSWDVVHLYLIILVPIISCIYSCDITYKAAQNLSANLLAASKLFEGNIEILEKLKDVSYKIQVLHNGFSAAGFIKIDRKTAASLLTAVGSYFLVLQPTYVPDPNRI